MLRPGWLVICFHGANKVGINRLTEKPSFMAFRRGPKLLITCFQPVPYHQEKNAVTSISSLYTNQMAERQGFEPWMALRPYTRSRRASSTTPAPLLVPDYYSN